MTELNKEVICIGEKSIPLFSQAYCEADVIVPDVYPDIAKVIQVSSTAGITDKVSSNDRITIDARAEIVILYLGDDENVYSISANQQISHLMDAKGAKEGMYTEAEISVDNIDYTILNSRKMNVKVLMGIDVNALEDVTATLCTSMTTDENYEILNQSITPYKTVSRVYEQLCIREKLELPGGKPSIEKILRVDACIRNKEYSLSTNKMIVKGTILVSTVYCSDTDGKIHCAEHEVPFTEIIAMQDVNEDMKAKLKLCVNRIFYKPEADLDGDSRCIVLECIITANAKACCQFNTNVVRDVYCTGYPINIECENTTVTRLVSENSDRVSLKDIVTLGEDTPDITQIFNVSPRAYLANAKIENKKVIVDGIIETDIMYVSAQSSSPINTHTHQQSFSHTIDVSEAREDMICDVHIDVVRSSYTISLGKEIDLRFVLQIDTDILSNDKTECITELKRDESQTYNPRKSYCIKIYFAKQNDNLWSIAKQHRITKEALMEINNISSDSDIFDGRQLMIPIKLLTLPSVCVIMQTEDFV